MLTHSPHFEMVSTSKGGKVTKTHKPVYITDIFNQFTHLFDDYTHTTKPSNIFFTFGNVSYVFHVMNFDKKSPFNNPKFIMDLIITDIRHSKKNSFSNSKMKYVFHCTKTLYKDDCVVIMDRILNNRERVVDIYDKLADALLDPIHAKMIDGIVLEMVDDKNSANLYKIEAYIEDLQLPSYFNYENYVVFKYDKPMTENVKEFINNIAISSYLPDNMLSLNEGISEYCYFVNNATFGFDINKDDEDEDEEKTEEKSTNEDKKEEEPDVSF